MAILFSNEFNIPKERLTELGVFNVFVDEDSHFFINIKRLQVTNVPEFSGGYAKVNQYFHNILFFCFTLWQAFVLLIAL